METSSDDPFAEFAQAQSPGVTSLLKQCIADDDILNEVDIASGAQHDLQLLEYNAFAAELQGLRPETTIPNAQDAVLQRQLSAPGPQLLQLLQFGLATGSHQLQPSPEVAVATMTASPADSMIANTTSQTPVFSLGTAMPEPTHLSHSGLPVAVGRRRGRKPKPRLPDLQQRLEELKEQFQRLSHENVFLKDKLRVLERVVPYRDESVGFLTQLLSSTSAQAAGQASTQTDAAPGTAGPSPRSLHTHDQSPTVSGDSNSSWSGRSVGVAGITASAEEAHSSRAIASTISGGATASGDQGPSCTSNAATGIAAFAALATGYGRAAAGSRASTQPSGNAPSATSAVLALCPGPDGEVPAMTAVSLEELKRITPQDFRMLWKHICLQLGVLVTGAEVHGPGSSPYTRLERFLERALAFMDKVTLLSPACFVQSMYMNIDTGQHERPNDNFWITCARSLQLSQQQLAEVNSLAAVYERNVVPVVQQRLQLAMQLSTRLTAAAAQPGRCDEALENMSSVDELAQQLERNVLKEHQTHWNIGDFLCSSVLKPLQVAKALTVAYPYIPDGVAMLHAFKLLSANGAQEAHRTATAAGQQAASGQQFPSLAGLLASQLPALAGLMPVGAPAARQGSAAAQQPANPATMVAALANLMAGLQPAQLQALSAGMQPSRLQTVLAGLQAAGLLPRTGAQPPPGLAQLQGNFAAAAQLQGLAALLGAGGTGRTLAPHQWAQTDK